MKNTIKRVVETLRNTDIKLISYEGEIEHRLTEFKLLANVVPQMVWMTNEKGDWEYVNKQWINYTGIKKLTQWDWVKLVHPDDVEKRVYKWKKSIETGEELKIENRIRDKNGNYRWFLSRALPMRNEYGVIVKWFGTSTDIHDQKQHADEVSVILDSLPDMAWASQPSGKIFFLNKKWTDYSGLNFEESIRDCNWMKFHHPDDLSELEVRWIEAINNCTTFEYEVRIKNKNGEFRWHLMRANCVKGSNGIVKFWVGTITDIHEKKLYQEELELKNSQLTKINEDLDSFIYTASHDLKAPISNLEGLLTALEENLGGRTTDDDKVYLNMLEKCIKKLSVVISQIADIGRVQKNIEDDIEVVNIPSIFLDIKETINKSIVDSGAIINEDYKVTEMKYSKKNFHSILYNLVSNSLKYRDPNKAPVIDISTYIENEYIVLSVADNGLGFDIENKSKIFTMFKRLHDHVEGTGVGLYMAKRLVENEGGKIEVDSIKGDGTIFKIYFRIC